MADGQGHFDSDEMGPVADILMGAAFADGRFEGDEAQTVAAALLEALGEEELPKDLVVRMDKFDDAGFEVEKACAALRIGGAADRKALLALVARITECDDVHDLGETDYIVRVAKAIGAEREEYEKLVIEVISDAPARRTPPPVPKKKGA
jgi:uncharacterized tellurite resistance protein B-like protein